MCLLPIETFVCMEFYYRMAHWYAKYRQYKIFKIINFMSWYIWQLFIYLFIKYVLDVVFSYRLYYGIVEVKMQYLFYQATTAILSSVSTVRVLILKWRHYWKKDVQHRSMCVTANGVVPWRRGVYSGDSYMSD